MYTLHWRHNGHDSVSNHQPHDCLLNRLFRRRSKKHHSSASLASVWGIHRGPVNSPHKWPVTRKMFPFDDVIMEVHSTYSERLQYGQLEICCLDKVTSIEGHMITLPSISRHCRCLDRSQRFRNWHHWVVWSLGICLESTYVVFFVRTNTVWQKYPGLLFTKRLSVLSYDPIWWSMGPVSI